MSSSGRVVEVPAKRVVPPCRCLYCWRRGRGSHGNDANLSGLLCVLVVGRAPDVQCCREPLGLPADLHILLMLSAKLCSTCAAPARSQGLDRRRTQFLIVPMTMPIIVI